MTKEEKIILGLALVALVGIVVFQYPKTETIVAAVEMPRDPLGTVGESLTPTNTGVGKTPAYLGYNLPWAFSPPVSNVLPSQTVGQVGQVTNAAGNFADPYAPSCNCEG